MRTYSGPVNVDGVGQAGKGVEVLGIVSEGRMFRIFKARMGTRLVALKTPAADDSMSESILRREYELCRDLSHPCVVSTLGYESDTPVGPAIVMEYIEGRTLDEYIATAPSVARKKAVLKDILDGVDYLHHRGILHNDLKPDNIIVNSNGAARIVDFGLSASDSSLYAGVSGGTDGYSAPEVLNGKGPSGAASDIYSLGLLINLVFGGRRYRRQTRKCCRQEPSERYRSLDELRKGLAAADRIPFVVAAAAVSCVILAQIALPLIRNHLENNELDRIRKVVEARTEVFYRQAVDSINKVQTYEVADRIVLDYFNSVKPILDSLTMAYPVSEYGDIPRERVVAYETFNGRFMDLCEMRNALPFEQCP